MLPDFTFVTTLEHVHTNNQLGNNLTLQRVEFWFKDDSLSSVRVILYTH